MKIITIIISELIDSNIASVHMRSWTHRIIYALFIATRKPPSKWLFITGRDSFGVLNPGNHTPTDFYNRKGFIWFFVPGKPPHLNEFYNMNRFIRGFEPRKPFPNMTMLQSSRCWIQYPIPSKSLLFSHCFVYCDFLSHLIYRWFHRFSLCLSRAADQSHGKGFPSVFHSTWIAEGAAIQRQAKDRHPTQRRGPEQPYSRNQRADWTKGRNLFPYIWTWAIWFQCVCATGHKYKKNVHVKQVF